MPQNIVTTLFHQPFRCARSPADANGVGVFEPFKVNFFSAFYLVTVGVYTFAFGKKHLAVAAFLSAYKEDNIVAGSKISNIGHAVSHLPTNGIEAPERSFGRNMLLNIVDDAVEFVKTLRSLRIKIDVL